MQQPDEFLRLLEMERLDQSWRRPREPRTEIVHVATPQSRRRDTAFYNAGRYAEGARDKDAVKGQATVTKLLSGK